MGLDNHTNWCKIPAMKLKWKNGMFGGSKYGMRGATVGLIIGLFLGPVGLIIGTLIGAFVGEMIYKDDINYAIKAGFGSLLGFLVFPHLPRSLTSRRINRWVCGTKGSWIRLPAG